MSEAIEEALSDAGIRALLALGPVIDWNAPPEATTQQALEFGWTDEGDELLCFEEMFGSVSGISDTAAVTLEHTTWAPGTDTTADEPARRISHVITVVRDDLGAKPQAVRLDTGDFAARWLLPAGTSVLVTAEDIRHCSPDLTEAETFRVEQPHKYAQYLGE